MWFYIIIIIALGNRFFIIHNIQMWKLKLVSLAQIYNVYKVTEPISNPGFMLLSIVLSFTMRSCASRLQGFSNWHACRWHPGATGNLYQVATGCFPPASSYLAKCQAALSFIFLTLSIVRVPAIHCLALMGTRNRVAIVATSPIVNHFHGGQRYHYCFSSPSLTLPVGPFALHDTSV